MSSEIIKVKHQLFLASMLCQRGTTGETGERICLAQGSLCTVFHSGKGEGVGKGGGAMSWGLACCPEGCLPPFFMQFQLEKVKCLPYFLVSCLKLFFLESSVRFFFLTLVVGLESSLVDLNEFCLFLFS